MNLQRFCFWTTAGAGIWVVILTLIGYFLGAKALEWWEHAKVEITLGLLVMVAILVITYVVRYRRRAKAVAAEAETT